MKRSLCDERSEGTLSVERFSGGESLYSAALQLGVYIHFG